MTPATVATSGSCCSPAARRPVHPPCNCRAPDTSTRSRPLAPSSSCVSTSWATGLTPVWEPAGPTFFTFDGVRRSGTSLVTGLTKSMLLYNQNPHGIGTGSGLCFGDSGSPQLERGSLRLLSVTSGGNGQCNSRVSNYRVDTPQARAFLGQFLRLP